MYFDIAITNTLFYDDKVKRGRIGHISGVAIYIYLKHLVPLLGGGASVGPRTHLCDALHENIPSTFLHFHSSICIHLRYFYLIFELMIHTLDNYFSERNDKRKLATTLFQGIKKQLFV